MAERPRVAEGQAASHSFEPEHLAGESVGSEHGSGRHGFAEQPRAAAAAAGSDRPGSSQEAGGGQARRQEEERQAASHSFEPGHPAGESVGSEHESGRRGVAEQPWAAAAAAGSDRPGCRQEAGGGQARQQEEERQAASHSYEPEQPAGTSVEQAAETRGANAGLDGLAVVEGSAAHDPNDPFGLDELLPTGRAKKGGGKRGSRQELVQQPVLSLHAGAAHSVSPMQVGEFSATAGSEGVTMAMQGATGEAARQEQGGGGSEDHEEEPLAEGLGADGQADDSRDVARHGPLVARQGGYLKDGTAIRVVGLTRNVRYNRTTGVVEYTHQSVEGDEEEQKLVRVAVSIEYDGEMRSISVPQASLEVVAADDDAGANDDGSDVAGQGEPRRAEGRHT